VLEEGVVYCIDVEKVFYFFIKMMCFLNLFKHFFLAAQQFQFFNSTKPTTLIDKNEHKDGAEPDLFESESSSDSDEEPELSNVVMNAKTVLVLKNYSLGLNNFVHLSTMVLVNIFLSFCFLNKNCVL